MTLLTIFHVISDMPVYFVFIVFCFVGLTASVFALRSALCSAIKEIFSGNWRFWTI